MILFFFFHNCNYNFNIMVIITIQIDITQNGFKNFTDLSKNNPQVTFMVALGGWGEGGKKFSELVSSRERRQTFIKYVIG